MVWRFFYKWFWVFLTLFLLMWLPIRSEWLPALEGWLAPVLDPAELVESKEVATGQTEVTLIATIHRRDCEPLRLGWYIGQPDFFSNQQVPAWLKIEELSDEDNVETATILVHLPLRQIEENSHAYVWHHCPRRWWMIRTRIW